MTSLYPDAWQIKPMKYSKTPADHDKLMRELESGKYIAQPKMDGYHYILEKTDSGNIYFFSRAVSKKTGELTEKIDHVPHIKNWAKQLPNGTILCGEIYKPGGTSKDVTRIMGALTDKAIERQSKEGLLHYYIFDMIRFNGEDMRQMGFEKRYSDLCSKIDISLNNPDYIEVAPSLTGFGMYDNIMRIIDEGGEGAVVKAKDGIYKQDSRPKYNFKVKKHKDNLDFIVMGFVDPNKEYNGKELSTWKYYKDGIPVTKPYYYGWKVGFILGAYNDNNQLREIGHVTSGITDEMCADMAACPEKYLGNVVEIEVMSLDKERLTFRHPLYVRAHFDKPAKDCRISEIFES